MRLKFHETLPKYPVADDVLESIKIGVRESAQKALYDWLISEDHRRIGKVLVTETMYNYDSYWLNDWPYKFPTFEVIIDVEELTMKPCWVVENG